MVVLYVDDEPHNLSAFKASFRRNCVIHLANSAKDAFSILNEIKPHIIISDQRMPEMTGIEFFEKVKESHPNSIRTLLTAYTNSQTVIDAVNKGRIDSYLIKPWSTEIMTSSLESSYSMYQARVALHEKNEELIRTNAELNRFVYSVSHDLRAPLMSVLGLINLAKTENGSDSQNQYFALMEKSVAKMDNYIQTTLEYYRNFRSEINYETVNFDTLICELIESLESAHQKVKFNYTFEGTSEILIDLMRVKICCGNILSNAVKYGKKGNEEYEIRVQSKNTDSELIFEVSDDGIGISEENLPRIFDMFYRGPESATNKSTGLGLYLVQEAVKRINGTIDVKSKVGVGTTFSIRIPHRQ